MGIVERNGNGGRTSGHSGGPRPYDDYELALLRGYSTYPADHLLRLLVIYQRQGRLQRIIQDAYERVLLEQRTLGRLRQIQARSRGLDRQVRDVKIRKGD